MISGIYSIYNSVNGKTYIGSSTNIKYRWYNHRSHLRKNDHKNKHLQNDWNKYGENVFEFSIIEEVSTDNLHKIEQMYLDIANKLPDRYYNLTYDIMGGMCNKKHSDKTKELIRTKVNESYARGQSKKFSEAWKSTSVRQRHVDNTMYSFKNRVTNECFTGRQVDFYKKYNLNNGIVCCVIKGKRPHTKGWELN